MHISIAASEGEEDIIKQGTSAISLPLFYKDPEPSPDPDV